jgi:hypothetical protein
VLDPLDERIASAAMSVSARLDGLRRWAPGALVIVAGAALLRVISGVGFANYDTLYALAWGNQLGNGEAPSYGIPIAPTPHPLIELLGLVLKPLGAGGAVHVTVALAFGALAGCGWVIYRLGSLWFGRGAGVVAALVFLTREPVLSYGVRAYIDVPYLLLVLGAVLLECRRPRRGAAVLVLLALAGLLRPEAWVFSGLYWLYLLDLLPARVRARLPGGDDRARTRAEIARLTLLAAAAPLVWILSDFAITGHPLWSLTNTRHTATTLDRETGIAKVPEYIPRRIGEILRPPVLVGAALGGVLSLWLLRRRALAGAALGVLAVVVFAAFASAGLPINSRYAFLAAAVLCVFCGACVFGWSNLPADHPARRPWIAVGMVVLVALLAFVPAQYRSAHRAFKELSNQHRIEGELLALVDRGAINLRCGPVGVPNHAPIPLLALYLNTDPANVQSAQEGHIPSGVYVDPASKEVEEDYVLDRHDPHTLVSVPPGFVESAANHSWFIFKRC